MNIRKGIKDVWWRPYMVLGAKFSENDIPSCPTTAYPHLQGSKRAVP